MDGHYENAIPAMRLAVQRDPQNEIYHFRYGLLLTTRMHPRPVFFDCRKHSSNFRIRHVYG